MKRSILFITVMILAGLINLQDQSASPDIYFDDEPGTHNMGITEVKVIHIR